MLPRERWIDQIFLKSGIKSQIKRKENFDYMKKYSIKRLSSLSNNLIRLNGVTYYSTPAFQSAKEDQILKEITSSGGQRKVNIDNFKRLVKKETLESPINKRLVRSKDSIIFTNKESDQEVNCFLSKSLSGLLFRNGLFDGFDF